MLLLRVSEKAGCDLAGSELSSSCCVAVVRQRGPDGGLQQLQMPAREALNLPEEGLPEPESAGAGAETPPQEGTEQEVRDRRSLLLRGIGKKYALMRRVTTRRVSSVVVVGMGSAAVWANFQGRSTA